MSEETADKTGCQEWQIMLHGFVDDELDSVHSAQFESHLTTCPHCTAELERLQTMRRMMRQEGVKWPVPAAVRAHLLETLSRDGADALFSRRSAQRERTGWRRGLRYVKEWSFVPSLAALAASLFLFIHTPTQNLPIQDQILSSHIRSLLANHLTDVLTSDQHTVKPWFNGKIDFSPPVVDLTPQGFPLVGGRVDYIGDRVVAALIYRRRAHIINVFVWPEGPEAETRTVHDGYNVIKWSAGGLTFWAVSDVAAADLSTFHDDFIKQAGL